nr:MAG TPA: hypothetical protein [Caudoviricetes sp.]
MYLSECQLDQPRKFSGRNMGANQRPLYSGRWRYLCGGEYGWRSGAHSD